MSDVLPFSGGNPVPVTITADGAFSFEKADEGLLAAMISVQKPLEKNEAVSEEARQKMDEAVTYLNNVYRKICGKHKEEGTSVPQEIVERYETLLTHVTDLRGRLNGERVPCAPEV